VTDAVNPEWIAMEVTRRGLELDKSGSLVLLTVEDDFPNGFVVLVIIDQRSKELVDHSSLHSVGLARYRALLEMLNTPLDEVRAALPLELVGNRIKELDVATGVVKDLLPLWSHRPHLHLGTFFGPVCSG
jgi:hypothetical protein